MRKYRATFDFVKTEEQAQAALQAYRDNATPYVRKRYPGCYTPWESQDGTEHLFVVWTYR